MYKVLSLLLFIAFMQPASAKDCPASYRFVDFGVEGLDGTLRRGGTIFRAFNTDGARFLVLEHTICLTVDIVSRDGRALPIPVVSAISINPSIAALDLTALRLRAVDDAVAVANKNAENHRETLGETGVFLTRGQNYLCAGLPLSKTLSCEVLSPYVSRAALVIYCDAQQCEMPAFARDDQLIIHAVWRNDVSDPQALADEISNKVEGIYDFLEGQF